MARTNEAERKGIGPLALLAPGEAGLVVGLSAGGLVRRRLLDLGFVPGTVLRAVRRSPLGDPTAYSVRGAVIALRAADANNILVRRAPESTGATAAAPDD
ncbi:MAG: ferrous iron transport protein A [Bacillota bacterium]|nr:MAG: ferrous iron transport protein A [Bacillota bacterium]